VAASSVPEPQAVASADETTTVTQQRLQAAPGLPSAQFLTQANFPVANAPQQISHASAPLLPLSYLQHYYQAPLPPYLPYGHPTYGHFQGLQPPLSPRFYHSQATTSAAIPNDQGQDPAKNPSIYPLTAAWLQELDLGPRGLDNRNFAQFADTLVSNGYSHVFQIAEEAKHEGGAWDLAHVCHGMSLGVAKLLIKYAAKDCEAIRRKGT
jgi:hypothetical protein